VGHRSSPKKKRSPVRGALDEFWYKLLLNAKAILPGGVAGENGDGGSRIASCCS
jgi:hypothetical protein